MKVKRLSVVQQVIEFLRQNIENGTWPIGEKIPSEHELTELLGVSRASARVAIQQFIAIGVLESLHGKGTFVRNNDLSALGKKGSYITKSDCEDVRKVFEFRMLIEPEGCYFAAKDATEQTIEKLKRHLEGMKANIGNSKKFMKEDALFHEEIAKASENHLIYKSLKQVFDTSESDNAHVVDVFGYKDGIYYHTVILKAIMERDTKAAKKCMYEHLQQAIDRME
ncbi:MAG: FadR/GntR family transcriptional regulator [Treponemataceae bacterium]